MRKNKQSVFKAFTVWSILLILVFAIIIFLPAINENRTARNDLLKMWHSQAALLSETVLRSADKIAVFDREARQLQNDRLMDLARYVRQLDSLYYPKRRPILTYIRSQAPLITVFLDKEGKIISPRRWRNREEPLAQILKETVRQVQNQTQRNRQVWLLQKEEKDHPLPRGVIVRRAKTTGYIALIERPAMGRHPLTARRLAGWLNHIVQNPGIEYIILWKDEHILAQSGPTPPPPYFPPRAGPPVGEIRRLGGRSVFEFLRAEPNGLSVAIGLSTKPYDDLLRSLVKRLVLSTLLLLFVGGILSFYILKRQNYQLLSRKYEQLQTSTSAILENMDEGIIVLDRNRKVVLINHVAKQLFSNKPDSISGKSLQEAGLKISSEIIIRLLQFEVLRDMETEIRRNGQIRSYLIHTQPLTINSETKAGGKEQIYLILLRDNTNQKELAAYRQRQSKLQAMGELASRVAHEIRNPLNGIGVLAQRLAREFKPRNDEVEYRQMTEAIRQESKRINRIIETFLAYARQPQLHLKKINLNKLIEENRPVFDAAGTAPVVYELDSPCQVMADAEQITQALLNLLKNAMDVTPPDKSIRLKLRCSAQNAQILVEDGGAGISEDIKDKLFDLYFTTKEDGNGLGLSVVEKIISSHGGKVRCENMIDPQSGAVLGARFIIELPLAGKEVVQA